LCLRYLTYNSMTVIARHSTIAGWDGGAVGKPDLGSVGSISGLRVRTPKSTSKPPRNPEQKIVISDVFICKIKTLILYRFDIRATQSYPPALEYSNARLFEKSRQDYTSTIVLAYGKGLGYLIHCQWRKHFERGRDKARRRQERCPREKGGKAKWDLIRRLELSKEQQVGWFSDLSGECEILENLYWEGGKSE